MVVLFIPASKRYIPGCTRKHTFKVKWSAGKVLTVIFWDSSVVLLVDCLEHGHPVNPNMSCCPEKLAVGHEKTSQSSKWWCGFPPWQYSAAHGTVDLELVANLCWEILYHPLYSLDLAPCNFHLFHVLKAHLSGHHFPLMKMSNILQSCDWHIQDGQTYLKPWPFKRTMFNGSVLVTPSLYIVSFLY